LSAVNSDYQLEQVTCDAAAVTSVMLSPPL
jgi:hypothetical protein